MVVGAETYKAGLWSKQALDRMMRDGVSPTPRNYAVYYVYASGNTPALNTAYEKAYGQGRITQHICEELFYKFIVGDEDREAVKQADKAIEAEVKKVMALIETSARETGQFGENLDMFSGKLKTAKSIEALHEAVKKITSETQAVFKQNETLQKELADTSAQLVAVRDDFDRAHHEAQIDPLTEIGNRKFFDREVVRTIGEAREQNLPMVLLMVDIDHFKKFNDLHGHLVGDQVLRLVARTLVENLKGRDVIARYGGEEFVIILPNTRLEDAKRVADHLRSGLANKKVTKRGTNETLGTVTISVGAAQCEPGDDSETLIARADQAMYEAKQTGRNRVVCAPVKESYFHKHVGWCLRSAGVGRGAGLRRIGRCGLASSGNSAP
ncbi:MAG: GGDEF domain-containing protein [Alphaproteobacteria bacterium]|nr:GGDEF domain-containing protein [Alphaproteobacteria bacterium]